MTGGFLDSFTIDHGPCELLSRFPSKAVAAAADCGMFIERGTIAELVDVNRCNLTLQPGRLVSMDNQLPSRRYQQAAELLSVISSLTRASRA